LKIIQSEFMVKGYSVGNTYYILKNKTGTYNIYQVFCELNKDASVSKIRSFSPSFKSLPDDEIIVSILNEKYNAFLLMHEIDIYQMNIFRIGLESEEIL